MSVFYCILFFNTLPLRRKEHHHVSFSANITSVFVLLVVFQLKHFIADFPLQTEYMLRKTSSGWSFLKPLCFHCAVHAGLTLLICLWVNPSLWYLSLFDFTIHFIMDRIKSGPRYLGRFNDVDRSSFWNCLGLDQMIHHFTHYFIIWQLIHSLA